MDTNTKLNSAGPLYPVSGGVWKIRKKQKADDHKRKDEKKREKNKEEKEIQDRLTIQEQETGGEDLNLDIEEQQIGYGSAQKKGLIKRKIDLTI